MVSPLQLRDLTTLLVPFPPLPAGSLPHDARCVVGPSCPSQVRRRPYESLLWIAVFTLAVTSARSGGLGKGKGRFLGVLGAGCVEPRAPGLVESCSFCLNRSVGCCCPPRASVRAATHWTGTSCARRAVPGASRSSPPPSPLTAESFQKHYNTPPSHQPPSLTSAFTTLSANAVSSSSDREIIIPQEFPKSR